MSVPLISVIIPIGKLDDFTFEAIESVIRQTYINLEILILPNGPNAIKISDCIKNYFNDDRIVIHPINFWGTANAANYGLTVAKGEYIARMDADDLCAPERFKIQLDFLLQNPNYGVVGSRVELIDEYGSILPDKFFFFESHHQIKNILPIFVAMCQPALMFRKICLEDVGGYKYGFMSEDHELLIRIAYTTQWKLYNIPLVLTSYRRHSEQVTAKNSNYRNFREISVMLFMYFLITLNFKFLIGIIYITPPVIWFKKRLRMLIRNFS